jgi:predicted RNA-binding protein with PUA-like domain
MARRRYWLFKSEPGVYSFDDLVRDRKTGWEGVRNHQARNLLRDDVQKGDGVLFYHSSTDPLAIAGIAEVVRAAYPDPSAFDKKSDYFDPKSDPDQPTWFAVDVKAVKRFAEPVTRAALAEDEATAGMMVLRRGARLSIQPVTDAEWAAVLRLAGVARKE